MINLNYYICTSESISLKYKDWLRIQDAFGIWIKFRTDPRYLKTTL